MKKFTKIMIGAGLTVAALGAAAAPANAAPSTDAVGTTSTKDMLVGDWTTSQLLTGGARDSATFTFLDNGDISWHHNATSGGVKVALPNFGETGKGYILEGNQSGKCIGVGSPSGGEPYLGAVDCASAPELLMTADGYLQDTSTGHWHGDYLWRVPATPEGSREKLTVSHFSVQPITIPGTVVPVDITNATTDTRPVFTGTGEPNSTVEITLDDGTVIGSVPVDANGNWTLTSNTAIDDGATHFTATQTAPDGSTSTDDITVTIVGTPIVDPLMAGGAALALLAAAGVVAAKRRNTANATA